MKKLTRRLIRIGYTSLAVILPKPWLDYHGIAYGDRIEVFVDKDDIKIKSPKRRR